MLTMLGPGRAMRGSPRQRDEVIAAVIAWVDRREDEIADIKNGCRHLLMQAAQELGQRARGAG